MKDSEHKEMLENLWRRPLTPEEKKHMNQSPEAPIDWPAEEALTALLHSVPKEVPPSNFTSLVVQAMEKEVHHRNNRSRWTIFREDWMPRLWPKMAWAAGLLLVATFSYTEYVHMNRSLIARDLGKVSVVASLPSPEVLIDFDAIQQLSKLTPAQETKFSDDELLAALQ